MTNETPSRQLALRFASVVATALCYLVMLGVILRAARGRIEDR